MDCLPLIAAAVSVAVCRYDPPMAKKKRSTTAKSVKKASSKRSTEAKPKSTMAAKPVSVDAYFNSLPPERRAVMQGLRAAIAKALPKGFEEIMAYGMPGWVVPLSTYPAGYHCTPGSPLPFLGLASQKSHIAFYHMGLYADPKLLKWFTAEAAKRLPKKLDMGKSCVRFKKPEDVCVPLIADVCRRMTPAQWIKLYETAFRKGK